MYICIRCGRPASHDWRKRFGGHQIAACEECFHYVSIEYYCLTGALGELSRIRARQQFKNWINARGEVDRWRKDNPG